MSVADINISINIKISINMHDNVNINIWISIAIGVPSNIVTNSVRQLISYGLDFGGNKNISERYCVRVIRARRTTELSRTRLDYGLARDCFAQPE